MVRTLAGCPPQLRAQDPQGSPECFLAPFWSGEGIVVVQVGYMEPRLHAQ